MLKKQLKLDVIIAEQDYVTMARIYCDLHQVFENFPSENPSSIRSDIECHLMHGTCLTQHLLTIPSLQKNIQCNFA